MRPSRILTLKTFWNLVVGDLDFGAHFQHAPSRARAGAGLAATRVQA